MKYVIYSIIIIAITVSNCACSKKKNVSKQKKNDTEEKVWNFKEKGQLQDYLKIYIKDLNEKPELLKATNDILQKNEPNILSYNKENQLNLLYYIVSDPNSKGSSAQGAVLIFCELGAGEIVKEALLHRNKDVVIIACDFLIQKSQEGKKETSAIQNLIYVLNENNYPGQGSESATIHVIMKHKLLRSIQQITNIDIDISKIDIDNPDEVERILSTARDWAKKNNIKLLDK